MDSDLPSQERDLFRETMEKMKASPVWEKLPPERRADLLVKYLRLHFEAAVTRL
jgi:hypothetical protein